MFHPSKIFRFQECIISVIILSSGLVSLPLHAGTIEESFSVDGDARLTGSIIYRDKIASWALNYRFSPEMEDLFIASANGPWFSFGSLGDAGLSTEIRNPSCDALGRLDERTFHHAELRSFSLSRFGFALRFFEDRVGMAFMSVGGMPVLQIRGEVLCGDLISVEGIIQVGTRTDPNIDSTWYPDRLEDPGACLLSPALRCRLSGRNWKTGLTVQASIGRRMQPGYLVSFAGSWRKEAWRFRGRTSISSYFFRSADRAKPDEILGLAFDLNHRPSIGFQFKIKGQFGIGDTDSRIIRYDQLDWAADLLLGWRWKCLQLWGQTVWKDSAGLPGNLKAGVLWIPANGFASLDLSIVPAESLECQIEGEIPLAPDFFIRSGLKVTVPADFQSLLWRWKLRVRLVAGKNTLIYDISVNDFPRDWSPLPAGAGDFSTSFRFIRSFSD